MDKTILNISTFNNITNNMLPTMIKLLIAIGITICLLSIVISIYLHIKKYNIKMILRYFIITFISGAIVSIGGFMVNIIANFNIEFSSYKIDIPLYFLASLIIFFSIIKMNKSK